MADPLFLPVALVATAVVSGGAIEFTIGTRRLGVNAIQIAAALSAILAARHVAARRSVRIDLVLVPVALLVLLPFVQALRYGISPLSAGGLGRFLTIILLLLSLPQFVRIDPGPPPPAGTRGATRPRPTWPLVWMAMGVALAVMVLWKVVPALADASLAFYDLKDVVQLPLGNHNYVASMLVVALAVALGRGRWSWPATLAAALALTGLALTLSRGGWLSAVAVLLVVAVTRRDRATLLVSAGLVAGAVVLLSVVVLTAGDVGQRLADLFSPATQARLDLWSASWSAFEEQPLLGVGLAQFPIHMSELREAYVHAHNLVLHALATTGLVGAAIYLAYWGMALVRAWSLPGNLRHLVGLPLLGLFVHAQVDSLSTFLVYEVVVATLIGIAGSQPGARWVREVPLART